MTARALNRAKKAKNDEFFTLRGNVEKEVVFYRDQLRGKTVFCPCNDRPGTAFVEHFHAQYAHLGLAGLIATDYAPAKGSTHGHRYDYGPGIPPTDTEGWKPVPPEVSCLKGDGDFRSDEIREILKTPDLVVVTNPPFSLLREFLPLLVESGRQFLVLAPLNSLKYKDIWPFVQSGQVWIGASGRVAEFDTPGGEKPKLGFVFWITNMEHKIRREEIPLFKKYSPEEYPTYDDYPAIEVKDTPMIPGDYEGEMGVPVSFLERHNPDQFEIMGLDRPLMKERIDRVTCFHLRGEEKFSRIVIRRRT